MKELKSTLLAANMTMADGKMPEGFAATAIKEVGGVKVGFVGLAADDTAEVASPGPDYKFLPSVDTGIEAAKQLRKDGAELVVGVVQTDRVQDQHLMDSHAFDLLLSATLSNPIAPPRA
jgi:2',3'-cyclic-nucleotide 2'-phosphodiesterase (5'-nucleotidase family)